MSIYATLARSSGAYGNDLERLHVDLLAAERTLADYEAAKITWETHRTATSALKQIAGNLA